MTRKMSITADHFESSRVRMKLKPAEVSRDIAEVLEALGLHDVVSEFKPPLENERTAIRRIKLIDAQSPEICRLAVKESTRQFLSAMLKLRTDWKVLYWDVKHTEVVIGVSL